MATTRGDPNRGKSYDQRWGTADVEPDSSRVTYADVGALQICPACDERYAFLAGHGCGEGKACLRIWKLIKKHNLVRESLAKANAHLGGGGSVPGIVMNISCYTFRAMLKEYQKEWTVADILNAPKDWKITDPMISAENGPMESFNTYLKRFRKNSMDLDHRISLMHMSDTRGARELLSLEASVDGETDENKKKAFSPSRLAELRMDQHETMKKKVIRQLIITNQIAQSTATISEQQWNDAFAGFFDPSATREAINRLIPIVWQDREDHQTQQNNAHTSREFVEAAEKGEQRHKRAFLQYLGINEANLPAEADFNAPRKRVKLDRPQVGDKDGDSDSDSDADP